MNLVGCAAPQTSVVLENAFPASSGLVIYQALWQAVTFQIADGGAAPIPPGISSEPQDTVVASANTAYVVLAPSWEPTSSTAPTSFVLLQSRSGFAVGLGDTLTIPVDDSTFIGRCAAGSSLTQAQADVLTRLVFPSIFANLRYDASTCTTAPIADGDAGAP